MVAQGDGLGRLEVGEAGHHRLGLLLGAGDEDPLEGGERGIDLVDGIADPEPEVGGDLVVARAGGVEPAGGGSDQLGQPGLDMHVDVLERGILLDPDPGIFVLDPLQPLGDGGGVGLGDDALGLQHRDMGERGGDVLAPQPLVEADRRVDLAHQRRRPGGEPAAPHQVGLFVFGNDSSPSARR